MTTVVAAVGAALLAGIFALVGTRLGASNQHKAWLRAQRLESASEFLCASDELISRLMDMPNQQERWLVRKEGTDNRLEMPARSRLLLVGNRRTEHVIRGLMQKLGEHSVVAPTDESDDYRSARSAFVSHVRRLIHD